MEWKLVLGQTTDMICYIENTKERENLNCNIQIFGKQVGYTTLLTNKFPY